MGYDLDIGRVAVARDRGRPDGDPDDDPAAPRLDREGTRHLVYPEGTACAEVLIAGEERGLQAKRVFQAFGVGFVYKFLQRDSSSGRTFRARRSAFTRAPSSRRRPPSCWGWAISSAAIAGYLFAGAAWPTWCSLSDQARGVRPHRAVRLPCGEADRDMSPGEIRASFVFYIGAGAVASAGITRWRGRSHDHELVRFEPQGPARLPDGPGRGAAADRRRPADLPTWRVGEPRMCSPCTPAGRGDRQVVFGPQPRHGLAHPGVAQVLRLEANELMIVGSDRASAMIPAEATAPARCRRRSWRGSRRTHVADQLTAGKPNGSVRPDPTSLIAGASTR